MGDDEDLTAWLRAQLDEDERVARAAPQDNDVWQAVPTGRYSPAAWVRAVGNEDAWMVGEVSTLQQARHIARHDPARVLREVQAKRERLRFIEQLTGEPPRAEHGEYKLIRDGAMMACAFRLVRIEALPYADRPGYRDEWRP